MSAVLIVGCQAQVPSPFSFHLKFPKAFAPGTSRYQRLLEKAVALRIEMKSDRGKTKHFEFPPALWAHLSLFLGHDFPSEEESWWVQAEIWDRKENGVVRDHPVFIGKIKWRKGAEGFDRSLRIPLSPYGEGEN